MVLEVKVDGLKKEYKSGFSLSVGFYHCLASDITCVLGLNGAGKSTFFGILTGSIEADQGSVLFASRKMSIKNCELKRTIGYLPQESKLPDWVSAIDLLRYAASLYGLQDPEARVEYQLRYWDCLEYAKRSINLCSHGMQKRVGLALATIHNPDYLLLDEPFSGLDLLHTQALEELIKRRKEERKITILSTHIAPYAATLCEKAYIMKKGSLTNLDEWGKLL